MTVAAALVALVMNITDCIGTWLSKAPRVLNDPRTQISMCLHAQGPGGRREAVREVRPLPSILPSSCASSRGAVLR